MNNIISAIINLVENPKIKLIRKGSSHNRANNMGEALEEYIKDLFANTVDVEDEQIRNVALETTFSYLGNQNNPPDGMLHGGDAIEIKKIENKNSALALNSSYPKAKLFADSPMISKACRECENWTVKDMIYVVGVLNKETQTLDSLAFVYGDDYCASKEIYEILISPIKNSINEATYHLEKIDSKELAHINKVDPLGITYLRIRNMWGIENPFTVFKYVYTRNPDNKFNFMCIINTDKFNSFENTQDLYDLADKNKKLTIKDIRIKNPNNPVRLKEAKLITFEIEA
ncbi:MAG: NgoPII family restriction endonuclease [Treponema sp.]